jgi:predicted Zn-ribbon and HTH transcriptional regulator
MAKKTNGQELGMVYLLGCRCRCGHEWLPRDRSERPSVCPACKSPRWDKPKQAGLGRPKATKEEAE